MQGGKVKKFRAQILSRMMVKISFFNNGFPRLGPIALTEISSYKKTPERQDFRS
jgi:hypothetical protein